LHLHFTTDFFKFEIHQRLVLEKLVLEKLVLEKLVLEKLIHLNEVMLYF